jgi:hypothetical protein
MMIILLQNSSNSAQNIWAGISSYTKTYNEKGEVADLGKGFSRKLHPYSKLLYSITLTVSYSIPKLEISVMLSRLIQESTPSNLDNLIILCGKMVL